MAQAAIPLPCLNWDYKDQKLAFNEWKDFMDSYFAIQGVEEKKKWHYILLSAGPKGRELWDAWKLSNTDKEDSSKVFKKFGDHLVGTPNKWVARLEMTALNQRDNESIEDFMCRLRAKCGECMYEHDCDDHLIFQLIRGLKSIDIRRKLIAKGNGLKLDDAMKCAVEYEATVQNTQTFSQQNPQIDFLRKSTSTSKSKSCRFCGSSHAPRKCPAYGQKCNKCHESFRQDVPTKTGLQQKTIAKQEQKQAEVFTFSA